MGIFQHKLVLCQCTQFTGKYQLNIIQWKFSVASLSLGSYPKLYSHIALERGIGAH